MKKTLLFIMTSLVMLQNLAAQPFNGEKLSRGLIGIPTDEGFYLSWRMLLQDSKEMPFDIFRSTDGDTEVRLNETPITATSDFLDKTADLDRDNEWTLKSEGKVLARWSRKAGEAKVPYLTVPIQKPDARITFGTENDRYTYSANDATVADLDGDGEYEIVLKWEPSNKKLPPNSGFAGNTLIDAYEMDGTLMWRIDLGHNIRSGPPTTQFLVFDYDGDGCAELCCKTADATVDGTGKVIGDPMADDRVPDVEDPTYGKVLLGPEYVTVFEGKTGRALDTKEYIPTRYPLDSWGGWGGNGLTDNSGSRSDRFSAGVAFFDGKHASPFFVRGWYGRIVVAAWTFTHGKLEPLWTFDSSEKRWAGYSGMGNHSVTVGDFDGDGFDEACIGSMIVDHDGNGLCTTKLRHGDALHAGDLVPSRPGLEVFGVHENEESTVQFGTPGMAAYDGASGEILWELSPGEDIGRGVAADIDARFEGAECWGPRYSEKDGTGGLRSVTDGRLLCRNVPSSTNFIIYWDADPYSELLNGVSVSKWNWDKETTEVLMTADGCTANNGSKSNPCVSADIFGDWREEIIFANRENTELRIYTTDIPAVNRMPTLMNDRMYRLAIAWQNVAYNQPPHVSFDMVTRFKEISEK